MRKIRTLTAFPTFLAALLVVVLESGAATIPLRALQKEDYIWEDTVLTGVEPNILFFLDTSSSMTMAMDGELPAYSASPAVMDTMPLMRSADLRANMMERCTYGTGARPVSDYNASQPLVGVERAGFSSGNNAATATARMYTRWGADRNTSNNRLANPYDYYSPDPSKPYLLTFKDVNWANWSGIGTPPNSASNYQPLPGVNFYNQPMPADLRDYLPGGSRAGQPVTDPNLVRHLVPNDSRMYQMKLVLWRLLEKENDQMLSGMRIGVASNYYDYYLTGSSGALVRRSPFGTGVPASFSVPNGTGADGTGPTTPITAWPNGTGVRRSTLFRYGTAPEAYVGISGGDYGFCEESYMIVTTAYQASTSANENRHGMRAYLRVPFDYMYTRNNDGTFTPTPTISVFRELIDGVEQYNTSLATSNANRAVNDELYPGGTTLLASSFYGRNGLHVSGYNPAIPTSGANLPVQNSQSAVQYATGLLTARSFWPGYSSYNGIMSKRFRTSEGLMAGTALGSYIDFFSPLGTLSFTEAAGAGSTITQPAEASDTRGYFPIMGACQPNWVVVFTGGNEQASTWPGQPNSVIDPNEQLLELYRNSRVMRGRRWTGEKWVHQSYDMDNPIRTIFVGMMPTATLAAPDGNPYAADQPTDSGLKRSRKRITRMAHHGQPKIEGGVVVRDENVQPHFADNVPALIEALRQILRQIQTDRFASSAPIVMPPTNESDEGTVFGASYTVNQWKQWEGTFHKYPMGSETPIWRAESLMAMSPMSRSVITATGAEGVNSTAVNNLTGLSNFASLSRAPVNANEFRTWLYSYPNEPSILGDMEHTGITVVGDPKIQAWSSVRPKVIYIQTNRGVLHAIDFDSGEEKWGFIPPNIFQTRLWAQKFKPNPGDNSSPDQYDPDDPDKEIWYSGDGKTKELSKPLALLDGMLAASDFVDAANEYKTILIGNLGFGGNGFYAMDITDGAGGMPNFLWAVENARYETQEAVPLNGVKLWGKAAGGSKAPYNYSDLGLTIAAAEVRVTQGSGGRGTGVLPGGLGYRLGADSQGKAFFFFDPEDGQILHKIDGTASSGFIPGGFPAIPIGMGIAPVTYIPAVSGSHVVKEFFTSDSEGNVLYSDLNGSSPSEWKMKSIFQLRTTGAVTGTAGEPVAMPKVLQIGSTKGAGRWLFGGTSSLIAPGKRKLENDEDYIFGAKITEQMLNMTEATAFTTTDLTKINYMADTIQPLYNPTLHNSGGVDEVDSSARGWRIMLRPPVPHVNFPTEAEYVTTSPFLQDGVLYVSTYIERTRNPSEEKCPEIGDARLYALDPMTGRPKWNSGSQAVVLSNIKISGISSGKDGYLYLAIKELKPGAWRAAVASNPDDLGDVEDAGIGLKMIKGMGTAKIDADVPYDVPLLQYWKEKF